jgi:arylsulfatase A
MQTRNRREFLQQVASTGVGLVGGSALLSCGNQPRNAGRPNIVFILADDLGYADVSCYGQDKFRTPNIDSLAEQGVRFTDAYAGCTVCAPSRSVLMTGYHMGHTPIRTNGVGPLLPEELTVAEIIKKAGYATGAFGKWGLGDAGTTGAATRQGFDEFFGYSNQGHAHFYYPEFLYHNEERYPLRGNDNGKRTTYSHDVIAGKALDFIRRNKDNPFFCYVPFTIPHWELLVPEDSLAKYRGKFEERAFIDPRNHYARQDESHAAYAAMITRMDSDVGRITSLLSELKLDDDTIVFFSSDNGPALPIIGDDYFRSKGPMRGHKENLYEGGIRVPMIVRWPGKVPAGVVSDLVWGFQDFMPTATELVGAEAPADIDGISVLPALLGPEAAGGEQRNHEFMYWELPRRDPNNRFAYRKEIPRQAVRMGEWKAIRPEPDGPIELYNLEEDIGETRNVAAENPAIMAKIQQILTTARTEPRPPVPYNADYTS